MSGHLRTMPTRDPDVAPVTEPLTSDDAASHFRCESAELTRFFCEQAAQNQRRDISRTWVLRAPEGSTELPRVLGFYTLTLASIERATLPPDTGKRLPRQYPVPAILIGRLARDERVRRLGMGKKLLSDAHLRALIINSEGGGVVVVVDAKDQRAYEFYARVGYEPLLQPSIPVHGSGAEASAALNLPSWPRRMFIPIATLRKAYTESP